MEKSTVYFTDFRCKVGTSQLDKLKKLCIAAGISHASMAKLGKNENVTTDVLVKICNALQCDIGDIMEMVPETADRKDAE